MPNNTSHADSELPHLTDTLRYLEPRLVRFLGGHDATRVTASTPKLPAHTDEYGGAFISEDGILVLYCLSAGGGRIVRGFERPGLHFSKLEKHVVSHLANALSRQLRGVSDTKLRAHRRLALASSAFEVALARTLRARDQDFWNISRLIELMKQLSFVRYEGAAATSGFIYSNRAESLFRTLRQSEVYVATPFDEPVTIGPGFFDGVTSFRYVEGSRAAYVADNHLRVLGVIQLISDRVYGREDFVNHRAFSRAVDTAEGKAFGIFVTLNSEVDILIRRGDILRWREGAWTVLSRNHLNALIQSYLADPNDVHRLCEVLIGVAASRHGALVLVARDDEYKQSIVRHIDESVHAQVLRRQFLKRSMHEAHEHGMLNGILTSDGLTVFDRAGHLVDAGVLIQLASDQTTGGGGRTAAAYAASKYGVAIKVSADGPLQVWIDGRRLIEMG